MMKKQPIPTKKKVNADSLMSESIRKKQFANTQEKFAKNQIKKDGGNKPLPVQRGTIVNTNYGPSGNERMQLVKKTRASASKDSAAAVKAKPSLAPKPTKKKSK